MIQMRFTLPLVRGFMLDTSGQDMIEYALLSAAVAVVVAGFFPPAILPAISGIFSKIAADLAGS